MDAAEAKRNLKEVAGGDGKRERAPVRGVKVSDIPPGILGPHAMDGIRGRAPAKGVKASGNPTQLPDLVGKHERAPTKGVVGSDNRVQLLDSTRGGGDGDTPGSGKRKRVRAPGKGAKVSDNPSTV